MKKEAPDLEVIIGDAKEDPAFQKMLSKKKKPKPSEPDKADGDADQDGYLSDAFAAFKADDESAFKAAMTAWRNCE